MKREKVIKHIRPTPKPEPVGVCKCGHDETFHGRDIPNSPYRSSCYMVGCDCQRFTPQVNPTCPKCNGSGVYSDPNGRTAGDCPICRPFEVAQTICDLDMPVRRKYRIESEPNCPFELGAKAQRDADLKVLGKPQQWLDKPDKAGSWWRCTLTTGSQTVVQEVCESFAGLHVNTMGMSFPLEDVLKRNPKDKWQYIPEPEKPMEGKLELLK